MAVLHFSHSGVCVSSLVHSTAFYRDLSGFRRHHPLDSNDEANLTSLRLKGIERNGVDFERDVPTGETLRFAGPASTRDAMSRARNPIGLTHFSFNIDEIVVVSRAGVAAGGRVMRETQVSTPDDKSCFFVPHPEGYWSELAKRPADSNLTPTHDLVR